MWCEAAGPEGAGDCVRGAPIRMENIFATRLCSPDGVWNELLFTPQFAARIEKTA